MGVVQSKDFFGRKKIDEACSNTSLSKLRYVAVDKPKWKVFGKRELRPITTYPVRGRKGCPCGANGPCKQKVTPKGVTIHYPQKKRFAIEKRYKPPKIEKSYLGDKDRIVNKVKIVRPKKFAIPTWRMDMIQSSPFQKFGTKRRRRRTCRREKSAPSTPESEEVKIPEDEKNSNKPSKADKKSKKQLKKEMKELEKEAKKEAKNESKKEFKTESKKESKKQSKKESKKESKKDSKKESKKESEDESETEYDSD